MAAGTVLVGDYLGCYGQVRLDGAGPPTAYGGVPFGERPAATQAGGIVVQWVRTGGIPVPRPADDEYLLLTGLVTGPVSLEWSRSIAAALKEGRYADLARFPGELAGCLVTPQKIFLFRNATSLEGLLYRQDGAWVHWSTDPTDLVDAHQSFDREAIWRSCRGDMVFIYDKLTPVLPGQIVVLDEHTANTVQYDLITPLELPRRTSLPQYAEIAYDLILRAARPYADCGRIGILLSGGLDSSAVLCALVEAGADVVAYHQVTDDRLADESGYARAVCEHLGVPLVPVMLDFGDGYLSEQWTFPHPYNNMGFRCLEQLAERIARDDLTFVTWGREGDMVFGPTRYGVHDVLFGDLSLGEKAALCRGLICSRWETSRLLRSFGSSSSLFDDYLPTGANARPTDFLTAMPGVPDDRFDNEYLAREHCADLAIWRSRGIQLGNPLGTKELRQLSARLPNAYRLLPHQGRMITKPVLRLLLSSRLPAQVWRRYGRLWLDSPHKNYVLSHRQVFAELIGRPDSHLVRMGVVDPQRLAEVLAEPMSLRRHTDTLLSSAMTELFLRGNARRTQSERGARDVPAATG